MYFNNIDRVAPLLSAYEVTVLLMLLLLSLSSQTVNYGATYKCNID